MKWDTQIGVPDPDKHLLTYAPARPKSDQEFFEILAQVIFVSGFTYKPVQQRWPDISKAFHNFNINKVANLDPDNVAEKPGMIRNTMKIAAIVQNAQIILSLQEDFGSIAKWIAFVKKEYKKDPKNNKTIPEALESFKRIGPTSAQWLAYVLTRNKEHLK